MTQTVRTMTCSRRRCCWPARPSPAGAHFDPSLSGGFLAGFRHPLSGPDHLLAMVAVGLWGAFLGRPLIYLLPIIFPTVMAFGGALGMIGAPMPRSKSELPCR